MLHPSPSPDAASLPLSHTLSSRRAGAGQRGNGVLDFVQPVLRSLARVAGPVGETGEKPADYRLIFAERGAYACMLNGWRLELHPGDALIVKRGDRHQELPERQGGCLVAEVDLIGGELAPEADILFREGVDPEQQIIRSAGEAFQPLLAEMRTESQRDDAFMAQIENALMLQLFCEMARLLPADRLSPRFFQRSSVQMFRERLQRMFEQSQGEPLPAAAMAARMGVSVSTLTKRCRACMGRSPAQALKHYKMDVAAHALRQSDLPIKVLSHQLGFQNQYHFSRVFRQVVGTAPSAYRERAHRRGEAEFPSEVTRAAVGVARSA